MEVGEERREVGSSSQFFGSSDVVGTSGEVAACSGVTTSTQEEEDEVEVSEDIEDGEVPDDMEPENLEDDEESEVDPGQDADIEIDEASDQLQVGYFIGYFSFGTLEYSCRSTSNLLMFSPG